MKRIIRSAIVLSLSATMLAQEPAKPAVPPKPTAPSDAAAPPESAAAKTHAPTDLAALKPLKGQKIVMEGTVANAGANKTESIRYLNFTKNFRESVSLVFFANSGGGTFTKEKLATYVGKKVRVNGTLSEYNDALQIRVESLDQIKVIEEPAAAAPAAPATPAPAPATPAK